MLAKTQCVYAGFAADPLKSFCRFAGDLPHRSCWVIKRAKLQTRLDYLVPLVSG